MQEEPVDAVTVDSPLDQPLSAAADDRSATSPSVEFYRPTRLGIIHLLAWMVVAAVLLSMMMMSLKSIKRILPEAQQVEVFSSGLGLPITVLQTIHLAGTILLAGGLVGLFILVRDRFRGAPGRWQPGHWLLMVQSTAGVIDQLMVVVYTLPLADWAHFSVLSDIGTVVSFFCGLFGTGAYLVGAIRCPAGRLWRWVLGLFALGIGLFLHMYGLLLLPLDGSIRYQLANIIMPLIRLEWVSILINGLLLAIAVVRDLLKRNRRDWLHWLGVAMITFSVLESLTMAVLRMTIHLTP